MGFKEHVKNFLDKPALIMSGDGETVRYAELDARANQYAQFFRSLGLNTGDGIAFTLENCAEFFRSALAPCVLASITRPSVLI